MKDVFWWSKAKTHNVDLENFGDILTPYLLNLFTNEKFRRVEPNKRKYFRIFKKRHYFIIGSIIRAANSHTIVWGSGIISKNDIPGKAKFLAVRGPLTRKRLKELGHTVPKRYGDPSVLIRLLPQEKKIPKYEVGVIPHYVDAEVIRKKIGNSKMEIINILTKEPNKVIEKIRNSKYILSSSLHGIIVAHALGIPALWIKVSDNLGGDDIKFYDYFESIGVKNLNPLLFDFNNLEEIKNTFQEYKELALPEEFKFNKLIKDLIETFPFTKSPYFKNLITKFYAEHY